MRRRQIAGATSALALLLTITGLAVTTQAQAAETVFGERQVAITVDPDQVPVELGMRFVPKADGVVSAVRFYKNSENAGQHVGSLWTGSGQLVGRVTFTNESASGWQEARLSQSVSVLKGHDYVVSYLAPTGRYAAVEGGFDTALDTGLLSVPVGGGVYTYAPGVFPTNRWHNSNYFVDVNFTPGDGSTTSSPSPTATATASPSASATAAPTSTPTPTSSPSASATPTPTSTPTVPNTDDDTLNLPRIAWEGGSDYWKKFSKADAAGWSNPSFFPISVWYNSISTNAEVQYDKSLGVNTYIGMWEGTNYKLWGDNGMYWIGSKLNSTFSDSSKNWVGNFLDDEVDGRFTPADGLAHMDALKAANPASSGRFNYTNYTKMVAGIDLPSAAASAYVNNYTDAVSLDQYFYTLNQCSWTPYRNPFLVPISQSNCRTASSYGKSLESLRTVDARDGKLQPTWQFVENLNGGGLEAPFTRLIQPGELKGAVMNSVINEARGIVYFNQSLTGPCQSSAVFRDSQKIGSSFCGASQVAAAKEVNLQIKQLAPIINTQSYSYSFGSGLDTMLKAADGSVYVFAMIDGSSSPGTRSFQLPAEVRGRTAEVLFENRNVSIGSNGSFSDSFANEYSYHIYKIAK